MHQLSHLQALLGHLLNVEHLAEGGDEVHEALAGQGAVAHHCIDEVQAQLGQKVHKYSKVKMQGLASKNPLAPVKMSTETKCHTLNKLNQCSLLLWQNKIPNKI